MSVDTKISTGPALAVRNLWAGYDGNPVLEAVNFQVDRGDMVGIIGPNGSGKSTLIKLLSDQLIPFSGKLEINPAAKIGYFAQHQLEFLRLEDTPLEHLARIAPEEKELPLRNFLGRFGFQGDKALEKVAPFSGGEKARLVLALLVWQKPNLLLLDEPTNHLDLDMRHALTMALQEFEGAMVVVSHDRHLLRTTTDELYLVHDKKVELFKGDLDDYHKWLGEQQRIEKQAVLSENKQKTTSPSVNRKDQKRLEAEFRKKLTPFKKQITSSEKLIDKYNLQLQELENALTDSALYEHDQKARLTEVLQSQREIKELLEETEMQWMDAQEMVEQLQEEFDQAKL